MRGHGKPEIMNSDQGSQFTSMDFTKTLKDAGIQISMDGKGAWRDNARSGISHPVATNPGRGLTDREIHLRNGA